MAEAQRKSLQRSLQRQREADNVVAVVGRFWIFTSSEHPVACSSREGDTYGDDGGSETQLTGRRCADYLKPRGPLWDFDLPATSEFGSFGAVWGIRSLFRTTNSWTARI